MANETVELARYAAGLRYEDLPAEVVACAKDAVITRATTILKRAHRIRRIGRAIRAGTLARVLIK